MSRSILVTGSSRGIGKQIALHLSRDGFEVVLHHRANVPGVQETAEAVRREGGGGRVLSFDISDRESVRRVLEEDMEAHGAYYGVVCNAGTHRDGAFPAMSGEDWDGVIHTNLDGFYNVLHPVVMPMVRARKGGRIVVMSSVSGLAGNRGQVNYSAAKGGLIAASKALAVELASRRITVNCVAPGVIETDMTRGIMEDETVFKHVLGAIPAGRLGQADEVAGLVAYLFSDSAGYMTRQTISVNGGMF